MRESLQIKGTDVELTEAIKEAVRERAQKLDHIYDSVINCSIAIESPRRRYAKGTFYNVRIDLTIPGKELAVNREPHEDLYVAIPAFALTSYGAVASPSCRPKPWAKADPLCSELQSILAKANEVFSEGV